MKNYLKISIAICLAFASNNIFASEGEGTTLGVGGTTHSLSEKCCFHDFVKKDTGTTEISEELKTNVREFFGQNVSEIEGVFTLERNISQSDIERIVIEGTENDNTTGGDPNDNIIHCECIILGGCTMFIKDKGTLAMGSGSKINITEGSKLLISGQLDIEPKCVINIGSPDKIVDNSTVKGTGGYLIINAEKPIDLTNLIINLHNENSHLEIHGNDISISKSNIHRFNDKATVHLEHIPFVQEFAPTGFELHHGTGEGGTTGPERPDAIVDADVTDEYGD